MQNLQTTIDSLHELLGYECVIRSERITYAVITAIAELSLLQKEMDDGK